MSVFELYPQGTNNVLFRDAYDLHQAAAIVLRMSNRPTPQLTPDQAEQRKSILTIAAKLMVKERDTLLDQFCRSWLRSRDLPIPTYEQPKGSSDVGGGSASRSEAEVSSADRGPLSNAQTHDRRYQASSGEPLP